MREVRSLERHRAARSFTNARYETPRVMSVIGQIIREESPLLTEVTAPES